MLGRTLQLGACTDLIAETSKLRYELIEVAHGSGDHYDGRFRPLAWAYWNRMHGDFHCKVTCGVSAVHTKSDLAISGQIVLPELNPARVRSRGRKSLQRLGDAK